MNAQSTIYTYGDPKAQIVLIQPVDDHDLSGIENEAEYIRQHTDKYFLLIAFKVRDWNRDLSPWQAPAVFGTDDFGGCASELLPEILELAKDHEKTYYIGGYSLAGLFALWAVYQTDAFAGAAAASPSVWFPGFTDYMRPNMPKTGKVYLSLGNKEEKTRNPVMASVGNCIREAHTILQGQGIASTLEWNEGKHFKDADIRTAKAFLWVMDH